MLFDALIVLHRIVPRDFNDRRLHMVRTTSARASESSSFVGLTK
jgi:hypothetical protein